MSNIKLNKKVKFNQLEKKKSKKIGVFDENNFLSYINKRDLDNILLFESIFEANQYISNNEIETGTLGFVKEDGKYYYFDGNSFSWNDLFDTINLDSFINRTSSNIVTSNFKLTDTSSSVTFSILNNYVNIDGRLKVNDNNENVILIDNTYGIKSNKDFTEVEKDNNLLFAQRKYVEDKIKSINTSVPTLQKVLEKGNESVSGFYKIKIEPTLFTASKTNSVIFSEVYYNKIGLNTTSDESKVEIGIKDNILPYQYFKLNDNFIYLYPNNSPIENDISVYYPQKSGTLALLSDIPNVDNYLEKNKINEVTNEFEIVRNFGIPENNPESFILDNYISSDSIPEVGIGINDDNAEGVRLLFNRDKIKVRSQDGDNDSMTFDGRKISFTQYASNKLDNDLAQIKDAKKTLDEVLSYGNSSTNNIKLNPISNPSNNFKELNIDGTKISGSRVTTSINDYYDLTPWGFEIYTSNGRKSTVNSNGIFVQTIDTNGLVVRENTHRSDGSSFSINQSLGVGNSLTLGLGSDYSQFDGSKTYIQKYQKKSGDIALTSDVEALKQWVIDNFLSKNG